MARHFLVETSEKTIEINTLIEFCSYVHYLTNRVVTIIAPTQNEEQKLGFDDLIHGLPPGQLLVMQFKKPYLMKRPSNCVRFVLETSQMQTLLNLFGMGEAYYIFLPLPLTYQVITHRSRLLTVAIAVDPYNIQKAHKISQNTRTVRICLQPGGMVSASISDPRIFEPIKHAIPLSELCRLIQQREVGYIIREEGVVQPRISEKFSIRKRGFYLVHVATE